MAMPGKSYSPSSAYRYGFNGKENDDEVKGIKGSQQDYGMRIYDPRLGKFLSVDPLTKAYSYYTPYQFAGNTPIGAIDLDGKEEWVVIRWEDNGKLRGITIVHLSNAWKINQDSRKIVYVTLSNSLATEFLTPQENGKHSYNYVYFRNKYLNNKSIYSKAGATWETDFKKDEKSLMDKGLADFDLRNGVSNRSELNTPGNELQIILPDPSGITFESNKANLTEAGKKTLDELAGFMIMVLGAKFELQGYTDNVGDDDKNVTLSKDRAISARDYLISKGIDPSRLTTTGKGEADPVSNNDNDTGRAKNRRIEYIRTDE